MLNFGFVKIRNCGLIYSSVFLFVFLFFITGCSRVNDGKIRGNKAVDAAMNMAEFIMDNDAYTADSLMNLIDPSAIRGKERQARYALLYTAAEYKNYQPMRSDSLIMIAVRHYSISNNLDFRFLSYYYLGCVYVDLKQYQDAAVAFAQAEQLIGKINNSFWEGLLYYQLGEIFNAACDYNRAETYYLKAESCYDASEKYQHKLFSLFKIGISELNLHNFNEADSIIQIVEYKALLCNDSILYTDCIYNRLYCCLLMNKTDSVSELFNRYVSLNNQLSDTLSDLEIMALYYNSVKDYVKAESYLKQAWSCDLSSADSIYLYYISSLLAENKGQKNESLDYFREYISLQNDDLRAILRQPILSAQKEHYRIIAENELLKSRHARLTLILCTLIFMLIIVIVLVTYHYKKKRFKEQLYDSLAVVDELSGKIEELKNQVRVQFHERHDMSNRLYSMYFDSESQDKVTKQQLTVTINSLIKDYTAPDSVRKLDTLINESYDGIMDRLADQDVGLTDKELQLLRFSLAGLSSKSVSVIIKESTQNIYQIKSRLLKKVRRNSEELWMTLNTI